MKQLKVVLIQEAREYFPVLGLSARECPGLMSLNLDTENRCSLP